MLQVSGKEFDVADNSNDSARWKNYACNKAGDFLCDDELLSVTESENSEKSSDHTHYYYSIIYKIKLKVMN